ncbi:hypothetical protein PFLUV_G00209250 [Perca fluviatilis]|uniref:Uncharacterized protein n=1 Tax=Perca fluviatilis TaxID=8168 RepID=A0A6A5DSA1_PERFL|nr:hypothetical protein PFLUV_G00209250 [Perca fluviatilis]
MEKEGTQGQTKRPHIPNSKYSEQQEQTEKASKKKVDNKMGGASKYKHQEGEKQEEGHDRLSKNKEIPQMKSDLTIIAQKTGRTPMEDLDSSFSTFGEVQPTPERRPSPEETEPFKESPMVTERFRETPQTAATAETSAKTQIEVKKVSGVFCQAEAWKAARLATSATAMVWNLLLGTFLIWRKAT